MEVRLDKRYPIAADAASAWAVLRDIRAVAACMPGAQVTDQVDDTHFKGIVKSRIGPAVMSFGGDVELQAIDPEQRLLKLLAKGADKSGSSASMQLTARIEPGAEAGASVLAGQATIVVSGKLAQFGNRLLVPVSDAMLQQFADNFGAAAQRAAQAGAQLAAEAVPQHAAEAGATQRAAEAGAAQRAAQGGSAPPAQAWEPPPTSGVADAAVGTGGAAAGIATGSMPLASPAPAPRVPDAPPPPPQPGELNALGLLWTVFKTWFKGLFRRRD